MFCVGQYSHSTRGGSASLRVGQGHRQEDRIVHSSVHLGEHKIGSVRGTTILAGDREVLSLQYWVINVVEQQEHAHCQYTLGDRNHPAAHIISLIYLNMAQSRTLLWLMINRTKWGKSVFASEQTQDKRWYLFGGIKSAQFS